MCVSAELITHVLAHLSTVSKDQWTLNPCFNRASPGCVSSPWKKKGVSEFFFFFPTLNKATESSLLYNAGLQHGPGNTDLVISRLKVISVTSSHSLAINQLRGLQFVSCSVQHFGPDWNLNKSCTDFHSPQRMDLTDFSNPLNLPPVPPAVWYD